MFVFVEKYTCLLIINNGQKQYPININDEICFIREMIAKS